ncbi:hypothetical protein DSO57_1039580 [Entomophthora muscae]|uniref:Uncharacterized protein n=1 Tax=Entomophthora muscae TaxID=34485 RepID=A0ACC2SL34_9FUNG|nr:hypothetical protein DSO57_1039580 [Entomophthora muscae]
MNQTPDDESELYRPEYVAHNLSIIDFNRSCLSMVSGTASGILGLTGYQGFVFYFACSLLMTAIIYLVKFCPQRRIYPTSLSPRNQPSFFMEYWVV